MHSRISKFLAVTVVVGVGSLMVPDTGWAQDDTGDQPADQGAQQEGARQDSGPAEGSSADGTDGEAGEQGQQAESDGQADDDGADGEAQKQAARGPGGRKLRTDYPGNDEAMQGQMETDRIEGLEFQEGENPSEAYDLKLKELETKIDDLKEKVFQSKSRVVLLKETVLGGNLSGSRAVIAHTNDLGARFKLQRALYSLDGSRIFNESARNGDLMNNKKELKVFDGSITAGNHNVSVRLEYQGSGFGLFNYMKGYKFTITSSCQFKAEEGKATILKVRTVDKGGAFSGVENKPGIKCELKTTDLSEKDIEELDKGDDASEADGDAGGQQ